MHLDCGYCQSTTTEPMRSLLGCGWLPASDDARPWVHPGDTREYTTCAGYTTDLPEVIDIARLYRHWSKGAVDVRSLPRPIEDGIELLDAATNSRDNWVTRDKSKD